MPIQEGAALIVTARAAIYCRVSTPGQEEEGSSLDTQEQRCREHAAEQGYRVVPEHVHRETYTGIELWDRPKLTQLREAIKRREIDVVVSYALDRLSRDPVHIGVIISEAEHAGAAVEFVSEPMDNTPEGQLIRFVRGYAAKVEHLKISERSIRGKRARIDSGKLHNHSTELYGYRRDKAQGVRLIHEPEAAVVRRMFGWVAGEGASLRGIAQRLNEQAVPTPSHGKRDLGDREPRWGKSQVLRVLTNPAYRGETIAWRWGHSGTGRQRRTFIRPESEWVRLGDDRTPAIVSDDLWHSAQRRMAANRGERTRNETRPFLLRGLIRCAVCSRPMRPTPERGTRTYRCAARETASGPCGGRRVRADDVEAWVWEEVEAILRDPSVVAAELSRREKSAPDPDVNRARAAARRAIKNLEQQQEKLVRSFAQSDDLTAELMRREIGRLEQEKARHQEILVGIERQLSADRAIKHDLGDLRAYCARVAINLDRFGFEERRLALEALQVSVSASGRDWNLEGGASFGRPFFR